jgi:hypothetical protein
LVVRSFASPITILDDAVITILSARQQLSFSAAGHWCALQFATVKNGGDGT